ncbi:MAG: threonylcarbamoyl-AMP synthase [Pirellulaceae bacterium]|nr:MAG: threonylcarbamoyl-AMP synthase [Pirellulaceae bacterium]
MRKTEYLDSSVMGIQRAAEVLQAGGIVAFPTETVYGLGIDARLDRAAEELFQAKGRPPDNPLIVHLARIEDWPMVAAEMPLSAAQLLHRFAPGPLTVVVPKAPAISARVTAGLDTVGLRIPAHPVARELLLQAGVPVAAPSANRSGRPSATTWKSVREDLDGRIDAVLCADTIQVGVESTVVDCTGQIPIVLRSGGVTMDALRQACQGEVGVADQSPELARRSPGVRHPHYQPRAEVVLVDCLATTAIPGDATQPIAYCGLTPLPEQAARNVVLYRHFASVEDYARGFYEFLREADRAGARIVLVEPAPASGVGWALLDRQRRAAAPRDSMRQQKTAKQ